MFKLYIRIRRWLRNRKGTYRCDNCGMLTLRTAGKAKVVRKSIRVPAVGILPASTIDATQLHCPSCR